jgi:hypothetical protein
MSTLSATLLASQFVFRVRVGFGEASPERFARRRAVRFVVRGATNVNTNREGRT